MHLSPIRFRRRERVRWWRMVPGSVVGAASGAILVSRWSAVLHSHPAYLVTLVVLVAGGGAVCASSLVRRDPGTVRNPSHSAPPPTVRTWVARIAGVTASILVLGAITYLRPLSAAPSAVTAMAGTPSVQVAETRTRIWLRPTGTEQRTGLVFHPGALVDPRAYVPNLLPIAEAGFPVVIIKAPYGLAILDPGGARTTMDSNGGIERWVAAGHSLGGVTASSVAGGSDRRVRGLLLWASFPNGSIAERTDLAVTSISGSEDGLSTPAKIDASASDLPVDTEFIEVQGATHVFFGDYGTQSGDGTATTSCEAAQREIQAASIAFLRRVDALP